MNMTKTALLMAAMTALLMGFGYLLGGSGGAMIALVVAGGMNFWSYWNSADAVLRMHNAQEVDENSAPHYYEIVRRLAERAELPMPRVYIIDEHQPNAFATGRNPQNAAVAATTGLLNSLTDEEIAGVMAHELAHVEHHDTLIMTITATIAGAISMLANFAMFFGNSRDNPLGFLGSLITMIVAPFAAMIVQMAVSRTREYAADRRGAEICGNPDWLSSALNKIARGAAVIENEAAEHNPASAHMFIINPLADTARDNLFSTHPDTGNRIAALNELAREWGVARSSMSEERSRRSNESESRAENRPWGTPGRNTERYSGRYSGREHQGTDRPDGSNHSNSGNSSSGGYKWGRGRASGFVDGEGADDHDRPDNRHQDRHDDNRPKGPWG